MRKILLAVLEILILDAMVIGFYILFRTQVTDFLLICLAMFIVCYVVGKTSKGHYLFRYINGAVKKLQLGKCGKNFRVDERVRFFYPKKIEIGDYCDIAQNVVFAPLVNHRGGVYPSRIIIGNRVHFGAFDRIASMNEVRIDDDVLFAAFVHITDHSHDYHDIELPINKQGVISKGPVHICRGAWLAFGCHVLSGVTVGEHSVVAANAVVTKDVPPYTVVAGNPARIVRQYDFESQEWIPVSK